MTRPPENSTHTMPSGTAIGIRPDPEVGLAMTTITHVGGFNSGVHYMRVHLRLPYLQEAPAGFGLGRLATAFMNNPGLG
jgi:hypothetical protein